MFYGRVGGVYVAIITLSVTLILELIVSSSQNLSIIGVPLGGFNGLTGIPQLTFGYGSIKYQLGIIPLYYFIITLLLILYLGFRYLLQTNYGYIMIAVRENPERTEMFGYDIRLIKLQAFTLAGILGGLGGTLYAAWGQFISPPVMGVVSATFVVIWVTIGGRNTLIGPIIATIVLQYMSNELASISGASADIILGSILVLGVMFFPQGIIPRLEEITQSRF